MKLEIAFPPAPEPGVMTYWLHTDVFTLVVSSTRYWPVFGFFCDGGWVMTAIQLPGSRSAVPSGPDDAPANGLSW